MVDYSLPVWDADEENQPIDPARLLTGYQPGPQARQHLNSNWNRSASEILSYQSMLGAIALRSITSPTISAEPWAQVIWVRDLGLFIAVATTGTTNRVATSPDGITWTGRAAQAGAWKSVAWSPSLGLLVAVGNLTSVMTSADGITWTLTTSAVAANDWRSVCWSDDEAIFVAVSNNGTDRVATSTNGTTWTARSASAASGWCCVVRSDAAGYFVAVANSGAVTNMTSADGITWASGNLTSAVNFVTIVDGLSFSESGLPVLFVAGGVDTYLVGDGIDLVAPEGALPENKTWVSGVWAHGIGTFVIVASDATYNYRDNPYISDDPWISVGPLDSATARDSICWSDERGMICSVASSGSARAQVSR